MSPRITSTSELVQGKYYVVVSKSGNRYIFFYTGQNLNKIVKYMKTTDGVKFWNKSEGTLSIEHNSAMSYYTDPTYDEIEHFKQCLAANKKVTYIKPENQNNQSYEIY